MKDRAIRFASVGVMFILSVFFAVWYTGGNLYTKLKFDGNDNLKVFEALITIISTPGIGFIISSTIIGFLRYSFPKTTEFLEPPPNGEYTKEYLEMISNEFPKDSGVTQETLKIKKHYTLYLNHQILLRKLSTKEVIDFITRRMDIYWTNINTIFALVTGFLIGLLINSSAIGHTFDFKKMLCIIPLLFYIIIAWCRCKKILIETNDFEKKYLLYMHNAKQPIIDCKST